MGADEITPFLEPTAAGPSTAWAISTAQNYNCHVTVGYPEHVVYAYSLPPHVARILGPYGSSPLLKKLLLEKDLSSLTEPQTIHLLDLILKLPEPRGNYEKFVEIAKDQKPLCFDSLPPAQPFPLQKRYNSTVTVNQKGEIVYHYRKCFLYYTDETWATEGPGVPINFPSKTTPVVLAAAATVRELSEATLSTPPEKQNPFQPVDLGDLGQVSHGICMDINPYKFIPGTYQNYEFATAALSAKSPMIATSMAWLTHLSHEDLEQLPYEPDMNTFASWMDRFWPINMGGRRPAMTGHGLGGFGIGDHSARWTGKGLEEVILIFANRCGVEGTASYAGTSSVVRMRQGNIELLGQLGRAEEDLLLVDTEQVCIKTFLAGDISFLFHYWLVLYCWAV